MVIFFHIEAEILYKAVPKMLLKSFMYFTKKKKKKFQPKTLYFCVEKKRIKPPAFSVKSNITF